MFWEASCHGPVAVSVVAESALDETRGSRLATYG